MQKRVIGSGGVDGGGEAAKRMEGAAGDEVRPEAREGRQREKAGE